MTIWTFNPVRLVIGATIIIILVIAWISDWWESR